MTASFARRAMTTLMLLSLCACQSLPGQQNNSQPDRNAPPVSRGCGDNFSYMHRISMMNAAAKQRELDRLDRALDKDNDPCPVLRLAIFLSWPDPEFQSDRQASRLFSKAMQMPELALADQAFATLLHSHVSQRQTLRNQIGALDQDYRTAEQTRAQLDGEVVKLRSQLEQLNRLEDSLQEKQQAVPSLLSE
ncbi:hypothetical protein Q4485_00200 [Granulosicoccaceae sp. 1_MG-2023]|nr:hypothetical protein [Granulosicoccaceae sp. 1_MG-2023]